MQRQTPEKPVSIYVLNNLVTNDPKLAWNIFSISSLLKVRNISTNFFIIDCYREEVSKFKTKTLCNAPKFGAIIFAGFSTKNVVQYTRTAL